MMTAKTYVEKVLRAEAGKIVFVSPDIVLSHDNTISIAKTFFKMGGKKVKYPERVFVALDHNAPPTTVALANDYQAIRQFVKTQGIKMFHDAGEGICHQLMTRYARPGMIITGSDSHTCTSGALHTLAVGVDRTETAGIWLSGETWLKVPQTMLFILKGTLPEFVFSKDIGTYITGMIGASGADYMSIEYHGPGVETLTIADRLTLANLAAEMGAKNAVFPCDRSLKRFLDLPKIDNLIGDPDASYLKTIEIDLSSLYPVVACPDSVDKVKSIGDVSGIRIEMCFIGTCSNGRLEDIAAAARALEGRKKHPDVQLLVTPASREIYIEAVRRGYIDILLKAGANILSSSCGPCLGTGQGLPADGWNVLSTSNRNFKGRMGNDKASVYLASPFVVAHAAIYGEIRDPRRGLCSEHFPFHPPARKFSEPPIQKYSEGVWNFSNIDDCNTDLMFAGSLTYQVKSSEPEKILPHLFAAIEPDFGSRLQEGDIVLGGENFGCGSSREHPAVGLRFGGVQAVIVRSAARIFFRSAINQGLLVIVSADAVEAYKTGSRIKIERNRSIVKVDEQEFSYGGFDGKVAEILEKGGLLAWLASSRS